jgi:hypothetical protein
VDGDLLTGEIPAAKTRLVQAWIEIHREELMADWDLAISGEPPFVSIRCVEEKTMECVTHVVARDDLHLELTFNTGEQLLFDARPYLNRGTFVRLQDPALFRQAYVAFDTVC